MLLNRILSLFEWMPFGMQALIGGVFTLLLAILVMKIVKVVLDALPFV